ncbi:glycosaminoglycan attachment site [Pseudorhodoferax sp.]|uniref:glycosaminoglycan attachment site n=1 Tax=Pseudorhodoferax sp. TaxID=1993553 RepID=UPI002DD65608|nr:glycosaminoglycan attachment site [Pseudorhodoferax sp.]
MKLFDPVVAEARLHPNLRSILSTGNVYNMDVLQDWARGFVDRDGKFVEEFQTTFNSSFWELYLFAVLKKYGMSVDFSQARPDFCIPSLGLNIEATIASNAQGAEPEFARLGKIPPGDLNIFNLQTIVRLSNSLAAKHRKYIESYAPLGHVQDRPYVVAVTNFDQPFSFMACQRPIEALLYGYYVDEERYIATGGKEGRLQGEELLQVFKDNGSPIDLGLFTTPAYREISAVIFSGCATMGKVRALSSDPNPNIVFTALRLNRSSDRPHLIKEPKRRYQESLLDGLRVYHNPFAQHSLDPALFRHPSVFQWYFQNGEEVVEQREGQLLFRCVNTVLDKPGSSGVIGQSDRS